MIFTLHIIYTCARPRTSVRPAAEQRMMQDKKRSRAHKSWCAVSGGAGRAAPRAKDATQTPHKNQRRVATMGTIDPTSAHTTGRDGQRGAAPTPSPQPKPCPTLHQATLPSFPPSPPLSYMLGRQGRDARGRAVRGPCTGCWRVLAACVSGCGGGQMGLGQGGHTRTNGLLTGADGQRMFGSNFR